MKILVSACLLGCPCRYDGKSVPSPAVIALKEKHTLIPLCPEILGGLPTPRIPAERVGDRVINKEGTDVTAAYEKGAKEVLRLYRLLSCDMAILKERSPACGSSVVYDGTFSGRLVPGMGVLCQTLDADGIRVFSENEAMSLDML